MKNRPIFIVLAMLTIICFSIMVSFAASSVYVLGDADGNGAVEIVDAVVVQRVEAEITSDPNGTITKRADIDGSGDLEVTDATWIQRYLADIEIPFSVGETAVPKPTRDPYELPIV